MYTISYSVTLNGGDDLGDRDVVGRIILKWVLKKWGLRV
jgi:hypothetical protein